MDMSTFIKSNCSGIRAHYYELILLWARHRNAATMRAAVRPCKIDFYSIFEMIEMNGDTSLYNFNLFMYLYIGPNEPTKIVLCFMRCGGMSSTTCAVCTFCSVNPVVDTARQPPLRGSYTGQRTHNLKKIFHELSDSVWCFARPSETDMHSLGQPEAILSKVLFIEGLDNLCI